MVLTNFESWAHSGSQPNDNIGAIGGRRNHDLFNISAIGDLVQCNNNNNMTTDNIEPQNQHQTKSEEQTSPTNNLVNISHISSNGYYGFSQICHQQNDENTKKCAVEDNDSNMMDVEQQILIGNGATRKRIHDSNIFKAKRYRFDDSDSQFDDFRQSSFAPADLTNEHLNFQQQNINQQQQCNEQNNCMINSNAMDSTTFKRNNLQNSTINNTACTNYNDMSRCMSSHMI